MAGMRSSQDPYGDGTQMVDLLVGEAYATVKKVADNLDIIQGVADMLDGSITGTLTDLGEADVALGGRIDTEITNRAAAITAAINAEVTNRNTADTALTSQINAEATARAAANVTLSSQIDSETTARIAAITGEQTSRISADNALGVRIDGEVTNRTAADVALGVRIDNEITARGTAETILTASAQAAAPSVRDRAPKPTDDSGKGYAINDLWTMRDGRQYKASSVGVGAAVWSKTAQSNAIIPEDMIGDRVTGASLIIAPFKMRAAYTGNCFRVKRGSDNTTLDIGFVYDSALKLYVADWAACDAFIAGSTTAWYNIIYDQSGNGYDLVEVAGRSLYIKSTISASLNDINGLRTFCFWGGPTGGMQIPAGHSVSRQNCTVISAGLVESSGHGNSYCELGTDASYLNRILLTTIARDGRLQPIGNVNLVGTRIESTPHVMGAAFDAAAVNYMCNDATATSGPLSAQTLTGGYVGAANGFAYSLWGDIGAFMIFPTALSTTTMQTLRRLLTRALKIQPQARNRMIILGDSITVAADTTAQPWWRQALASFDLDWKVFNNALEGDTSVAAIAGIANQVTSAVKAGVNNVVVFAYGTNDLAALAPNDAGNATTVQNRIQAHCAAIKTANPSVKIVVATILPRNNSFTNGQTDASFEASRLLINAWILANYATFADAVADYGGDAYIGQHANVTDTTWMNGNLHPKARGHAIMSGYVVSAVNSLTWP